MTYKITFAEIFKTDDSATCSINLIIDDSFIFQVGCDGVGDIPAASDACWLSEQAQNMACENINTADVVDVDDIPLSFVPLEDWLISHNIEYQFNS